MDEKYYEILSEVRLENAQQLIKDAQSLLKAESYKSANNRAFYAMEKAVKALLAVKEVDISTHNGCLKQFNYLYIYNGDGTFTREDYKLFSDADQIRSASDYDDFYIASKEDSRKQVENAVYFVNKVESFLKKQEKDAGNHE